MTTSDGNFVEYRSFVRGYHDYISSWSPFIGEELVLRGQPNNEHDLYAVAVVNNGEVVGHIPRTISKVVCFFLAMTETKDTVLLLALDLIAEWDWV